MHLFLLIKALTDDDFLSPILQLTEDLTLRLCDFNSTLWIDPNNPPTDGAGLGTPAYGAPELTRAISGGTPFGFKADVWSMGAVLYSLATGVEPFARAHSMVDILHRKRMFFDSEEEERVRRISVFEGGAHHNGKNSASASRQGSLRGRRNNFVGSAHRREGSADSLDSVASNLTNTSWKAPSALAIAALLGDEEDFANVCCSGTAPQVAGSVPNSPLARAVSINQRGPGHLPLPALLRRTASFQNAQDAADHLVGSPTGGRSSLELHPARGATRERSSGSVSSVTSLGPAASHLYMAVSAALDKAAAQNKRKNSGDDISSMQELSKEEEVELHRHYSDGMPALILPGGGRLPDAARDLLARMLTTDQHARPSAREVKAILSSISV